VPDSINDIGTFVQYFLKYDFKSKLKIRVVKSRYCRVKHTAKISPYQSLTKWTIFSSPLEFLILKHLMRKNQEYFATSTTDKY